MSRGRGPGPVSVALLTGAPCPFVSRPTPPGPYARGRAVFLAERRAARERQRAAQSATLPPSASAAANSPLRWDPSVPGPSVAWALWFDDFSSSLLAALQKKLQFHWFLSVLLIISYVKRGSV